MKHFDEQTPLKQNRYPLSTLQITLTKVGKDKTKSREHQGTKTQFLIEGTQTVLITRSDTNPTVLRVSTDKHREVGRNSPSNLFCFESHSLTHSAFVCLFVTHSHTHTNNRPCLRFYLLLLSLSLSSNTQKHFLSLKTLSLYLTEILSFYRFPVAADLCLWHSKGFQSDPGRAEGSGSGPSHVTSDFDHTRQ